MNPNTYSAPSAIAQPTAAERVAELKKRHRAEIIRDIWIGFIIGQITFSFAYLFFFS